MSFEYLTKYSCWKGIDYLYYHFSYDFSLLNHLWLIGFWMNYLWFKEKHRTKIEIDYKVELDPSCNTDQGV